MRARARVYKFSTIKWAFLGLLKCPDPHGVSRPPNDPKKCVFFWGAFFDIKSAETARQSICFDAIKIRQNQWKQMPWGAQETGYQFRYMV